MGPISEIYVFDVTNNARQDSGSENDDGARSHAHHRRDGCLESPEGERHHQSVGTEAQEKTTCGTQTASLRDVFGWDHHQTIVKDIKKDDGYHPRLHLAGRVRCQPQNDEGWSHRRVSVTIRASGPRLQRRQRVGHRRLARDVFA